MLDQFCQLKPRISLYSYSFAKHGFAYSPKSRRDAERTPQEYVPDCNWFYPNFTDFFVSNNRIFKEAAGRNKWIPSALHKRTLHVSAFRWVTTNSTTKVWCSRVQFPLDEAPSKVQIRIQIDAPDETRNRFLSKHLNNATEINGLAYIKMKMIQSPITVQCIFLYMESE